MRRTLERARYGTPGEGKRAAALLHAWRPSVNLDGTICQSLRGELSTRAAAFALEEDLTEVVVVKGGHLWGKDYPSMAELVQTDLTTRYGIDPDRVIADPGAYSTEQEVTQYVRTVVKERLFSTGSIAFTAHLVTIEDLYRSNRLFGGPIPVERLLRMEGDRETLEQLDWLKNSNYERNYKAYQLALWAVTHTLDPRNRLLSVLAQGSRNKPSPANAIPGFPIDVSFLPGQKMSVDSD